jgi:hypothetical protein
VTAPALLGSMVMSAHNEATVIRRCHNALLTGSQPAGLDVVACDGCTAGIADVVRSSGDPVRVMGVHAASKSAAPSAVEEVVVTAFPRPYSDADVVLTAAPTQRVLERLRAGPALPARPPIKDDTKRAAALVCGYYRVRAGCLPSWAPCGEPGFTSCPRPVRRFGPYPDVVAEDLFVDQHFHRREVKIVNSPAVVVSMPRRTVSLLPILRRTCWRSSENLTPPRCPARPSTTTPPIPCDLAWLASAELARAAASATYVALTSLARLKLAVAAPTQSERDNSSRDGLK